MKLTHLERNSSSVPPVSLDGTLCRHQHAPKKTAINKFEENFYFLIINSAFGLTMDSKLGREKLANLRNKREKLSSKKSSERNKELPNH